MLGNLEFALGRLNGEPPHDVAELAEVAQALGQAREGAERIGVITRDLKVFCRSGADEVKAAVDVRHVMESSINIAWNQIRHRARLMRHFARVPTIAGNQNRLGQVFLNLLINAAQSLPDDDVERNEISVAIAAEGELVTIEVSDTGCGIEPERQKLIFEPFFTTKPPGVGSGIGLSMCRAIVSDMGGTIACTSSPSGSTFRIELPAQDVPALTMSPPRLEPVELPRARILVIDDEPALCAVVRRLLRGEHEIVTCIDPREALKMLDKGATFDAILCDIMMPNLSGMDVYSVMRQRHPDLAARTVFMTGGAFNDPAQQFLRRVSHPVLEKPFESRALHAALSGVLEQRVSGTWPTRRIDRTG